MNPDFSKIRKEIKRIILSECRLEDQNTNDHCFKLDGEKFYCPSDPENFIQNVLDKIQKELKNCEEK